ncbi:YoaK family protein [Massilia sp. SM-13]|uniref:YoaK family protein n=1 Tax=Pseudoduganella rhizocola TaxID=3382643 RepID=UPI0038B6632D
MPVQYLRTFTAAQRTEAANIRLGRVLAFVAGAVNAGGFLAVGQYTSHMTGILSSINDNLVTGHVALASTALGSVLLFLLGAATSAICIHWGRRRRAHSEYATPLMLEAVLLLAFGLIGARLEQERLLLLPATVGLLCYVMGLQNAMITKVSRAEIRTTHVTGIVTDIGIELGKLVYWNRHGGHPVRADLTRLRVLASLLGMFLLGGAAGAVGFQQIGFLATVPLAALLLLLAWVPVMDDLLGRRRPDH